MGYDRTTLRSIAAEAGVDQKLVAYFYGSKHSLFVAASELPFKGGAAIEETLSGPPESMGLRLARLVLHMLDDPDVGGRLVGLVRAAASEPQAADMVRELLTREIWAPAAARLRLKRPELVVNLIATQILGLVMARYVVRTEPLASLPTGPAADAFAPALQLLLSGRYWSE